MHDTKLAQVRVYQQVTFWFTASYIGCESYKKYQREILDASLEHDQCYSWVDILGTVTTGAGAFSAMNDQLDYQRGYCLTRKWQVVD